MFLADSSSVELAHTLSGGDVCLCAELWHPGENGQQELLRVWEHASLQALQYSRVEISDESALEDVVFGVFHKLLQKLDEGVVIQVVMTTFESSPEQLD